MQAITPPMWLIYDMAGSQTLFMTASQKNVSKKQIKYQRHSHTNVFSGF
jgi:hypothetical protein